MKSESAGNGKKKRRGLTPSRIEEIGTAYLFILPMFAGLMFFSVIPFVQNIMYSFRKMGTFGEGTYVGIIPNFSRMKSSGVRSGIPDFTRLSVFRQLSSSLFSLPTF